MFDIIDIHAIYYSIEIQLIYAFVKRRLTRLYIVIFLFLLIDVTSNIDKKSKAIN